MYQSAPSSRCAPYRLTSIFRAQVLAAWSLAWAGFRRYRIFRDSDDMATEGRDAGVRPPPGGASDIT
jgi:hypothetical protein